MRRGDTLHTLLMCGALPGQAVVPEYVETVISHVFLFPDLVYKIYKEDATAFNTQLRDLSELSARNAFATEDATWNMHVSPHVYLPPQGLAVCGGQVAFVPLAEAAEIAVVSRRLDPAMALFALLERGKISPADARRLGAHLAQAEYAFVPLSPQCTAGEHIMDFVEDVDRWGAHRADAFGEALWQRGMAFLREKHEHLFPADAPLYPRFDIHALNAFVIDMPQRRARHVHMQHSWNDRFRKKHPHSRAALIACGCVAMLRLNTDARLARFPKGKRAGRNAEGGGTHINDFRFGARTRPPRCALRGAQR